MLQWHYAVNNTTHGPVPESTLRDLLVAGTITQETLVWSDGAGGDWRPLKVALPALMSQPSPTLAAPMGQNGSPPQVAAFLQSPITATLIGPKSPYYLAKWTAILNQTGGVITDKTKTTNSWNWAAFFIGSFWLFYRKMWRQGALALGIVFVAVVLSFKIPALGYASVAVNVLIGLFGNAAYLEHVFGQWTALSSQNPAAAEASAQQIGGTNVALPLGILVGYIVAVVLVMFAIGG